MRDVSLVIRFSISVSTALIGEFHSPNGPCIHRCIDEVSLEAPLLLARQGNVLAFLVEPSHHHAYYTDSR